MKALYSVAQIRTIEQAAAHTLPPGTLMQRAGLAAANAALALIAAHPNAAVLVLAGPGNNGGDALELAAHLADAGVDVSVLLLAGAAAPSPETAQARARAESAALQFESLPLRARRWDLVVDGLFGIGLARPLVGPARELVTQVNALDCPVLALDLPSGLDGDTGTVVGPDGCAIKASHTITFIGDKPGLHTCDGCDLAGAVQLATLGIDPALLPAPSAQLSGPAVFQQHLTARAANSHKGSFGSVAVLGGAHGMAGAAVLAARAALFGGAGRVYVAMLAAGPAYDSAHPELMFRDAAQFELASATLVVGPGMGSADVARQLLARALESDSALVLDADALNLIAADPALQALLSGRRAATVLTPHPLEAARLLGIASAAVQADRLGAAHALVARYGAVVVLKGAGSIVAAPNSTPAINTSGNPGLATGGTGDVLAGLCGALLAQGWPAHAATLAAVWMHGAAADQLVADGSGPIGLCASELPLAIRTMLNRLVASTVRPDVRPLS